MVGEISRSDTIAPTTDCSFRSCNLLIATSKHDHNLRLRPASTGQEAKTPTLHRVGSFVSPRLSRYTYRCINVIFHLISNGPGPALWMPAYILFKAHLDSEPVFGFVRTRIVEAAIVWGFVISHPSRRSLITRFSS